MTAPVRTLTQEIVHRENGRTTLVEYIYEEIRSHGETHKYHVKVPRQTYEQVARTLWTETIPFDKFLKVLRPLMIGEYAADEIPHAFRILDTDNSNTIDIRELNAFVPIIAPDATPNSLLYYVRQVDRNNDNKLDLKEFTQLILKGVGRNLALGMH